MYTCSHVWSLPVGDRWMLLPASAAPQPQPPLCHLSCPFHFSYLVTPWTWVLCGLVSRGSLAPGTRAQWTSQTSHHLQPALSHLHLASRSVVHLASFCSWASLNSPLRPHSWLCLTSYEHLCHIVLRLCDGQEHYPNWPEIVCSSRTWQVCVPGEGFADCLGCQGCTDLTLPSLCQGAFSFICLANLDSLESFS